MADIIRLQNCAVDSDLGRLGQEVLRDVQALRDELLAQVNTLDTSDAQTEIDSFNSALDNFLEQSGTTMTSDEISAQVGLPQEEPDQLDDEMRLEALGLVLINGVLYAQDTSGNVENFRKLYFALGASLPLFLNVIGSSENLQVIQTRLAAQRLPEPGRVWTVQEARQIFENPAIEKVYRGRDAYSYAVVPQFLAQNVSVEQVVREFQIPAEEVLTQVFWLREVDPTTARINFLQDLGFTNDQITSVLNGSALRTIRPSAVQTTQDRILTYTNQAVSQINLLNSRYTQTAPADREAYRAEIKASVQNVRLEWLVLEQQQRFSPILIQSPEEIAVFLTKNTQADLEYLFSQKRTITGINFQTTRSELIRRIREASALPAGSPSLSSLLANQPPVVLDYSVDAANYGFCQSQAALLALTKPLPLSYEDLKTAYACLTGSTLAAETSTTAQNPVIGYPSYDSPSSLMARRVDFYVSLGVGSLTEDIINLAAPVSNALADAIGVLISLIRAMRQAIDSVLNPLIKKVRDLVAQAEALVSRYMSYFGTATVDSSILKCAFGFELRADLPFLNDLEPALEILRRKLKNILAQIARTASDYAAKLLCLPINFLNNILKGATSFLPAICRTDTFKLPDALQAALVELRDSFQVESINFGQFTSNLFKVQATVQSLPAKLDNFREDLICNETPLNSRFLQTFRNDIGIGFGQNPVQQALNLIPPRG